MAKTTRIYIIITVALSIFGVATHAGAAANTCPNLSLPSSYTLDEKLISLTSEMRIRDQKQDYGLIRKRALAWGSTFDLVNHEGKIVATAAERAFSWGVTIDISDCNGQKIGVIRQDILKSLLGVKTIYSIQNPNGDLLAQSEKTELSTTDFNLKDASGLPLARIHRGMFQLLSDRWQVQTLSPKLDSRLYIFIAAYKTVADNAEVSKSSDNQNNKK